MNECVNRVLIKKFWNIQALEFIPVFRGHGLTYISCYPQRKLKGTRSIEQQEVRDETVCADGSLQNRQLRRGR
ncbi:MAG: hypothetical protein ABIG63_05145, partial [Chloroflexota bacterium]